MSRCGSSKLLKNHPHVPVSTQISRATYMRPSEFSTLKEKDLVPPLVPLLPCWPVVIVASVFMDERWLQLVNKFLPALKARSPMDKIWNFDYPAAAMLFTTATDALGLSAVAMYQTRHRGSSNDRVRVSELCKKSKKRGQSPSPARKQVGNICATCRGVVDKTIPSPSPNA